MKKTGETLPAVYPNKPPSNNPNTAVIVTARITATPFRGISISSDLLLLSGTGTVTGRE